MVSFRPLLLKVLELWYLLPKVYITDISKADSQLEGKVHLEVDIGNYHCFQFCSLGLFAKRKNPSLIVYLH